MRIAVSMFRTLSPKLEPSAIAITRSPVLLAVDADRARIGALRDFTITEGMMFESVRNIPAGNGWGRCESKFHVCKFRYIRAS